MPSQRSPGTSRPPFTKSAANLRERFLLSSVFYLALLPAGFEASLGAGSLTSMLAGIHTDHQNIETVPV